MRMALGIGVAAAVALAAWPLAANAAEMRGVTATEIRIGQTMPL
jgi:branched-chain amino acid transport system substrate-binding protein